MLFIFNREIDFVVEVTVLFPGFEICFQNNSCRVSDGIVIDLDAMAIEAFSNIVLNSAKQASPSQFQSGSSSKQARCCPQEIV